MNGPGVDDLQRALPRVNARKRAGRCYELCVRGLLNSPTSVAESWLLVHGTVRWNGPGGRMGHAWLVTFDGETVYDAVRDETRPAAEYQALFAANEERRYALKEVAGEVIGSGHWGPWHEGATP